MTRKSIPPSIQTDVLTKSKRRCALCCALNNDYSEKRGQIAHINKDNTDSRFENLVWLCFEHHDQFDSTTSQSKNYTPLEIKKHRDNLYHEHAKNNFSAEDIINLKDYLKKYSSLFTYLFEAQSDLAFKIHSEYFESLTNFRDYWYTDTQRSYNSEIRAIQDNITSNLMGILSFYEIDKYDLNGNWIIFNNSQFPSSLLIPKKQSAKSIVGEIFKDYQKLDDLALN